MWLQTVRLIVKKSKCAGLAHKIGFATPNSCSLPRLVKGATQLCTSQKECNKLHLTAAQYFWLADYNDWSRFAISSPPCVCRSRFSFIGGIATKEAVKLRHLILLSMWDLNSHSSDTPFTVLTHYQSCMANRNMNGLPMIIRFFFLFWE
jgi:hypothetical protein